MKNITVTIFVRPDSISELTRHLKILEGLDVINEYTFQWRDVRYSSKMISNWIWLNIPVDLWVKFNCKYLEMRKKNP